MKGLASAGHGGGHGFDGDCEAGSLFERGHGGEPASIEAVGSLFCRGA